MKDLSFLTNDDLYSANTAEKGPNEVARLQYAPNVPLLSSVCGPEELSFFH